MIDTYVAHYTKLVKRKENIKKNLSDEFINLLFEENFDQEILNPKTIDKYYRNDKKIWDQKCEIYRKSIWGAPSYRELTLGEISLIFKAKNIIDQIIKSESLISLYVEDDAIPVFNYVKKLKKLIAVDISWDVMFINYGVGKQFLRKKLNKNFLLPGQILELPVPSSNCTEAILFKKNSAKKIAPFLESFTLPLDYELAYIFAELDLKVMTTTSPLFYQGSKNYNIFKKDKYRGSVR